MRGRKSRSHVFAKYASAVCGPSYTAKVSEPGDFKLFEKLHKVGVLF